MEKYVETKWNIDENNVLHMQFPVELFMHIKDKDWVYYKNSIIEALLDEVERRKRND